MEELVEGCLVCWRCRYRCCGRCSFCWVPEFDFSFGFFCSCNWRVLLLVVLAGLLENMLVIKLFCSISVKGSFVDLFVMVEDCTLCYCC